MKKLVWIILIILTAGLVISCAPPPSLKQTYAYGDEGIKDLAQADLQSLLIKGETGKNEVFSYFGKPSTTSVDGMGNETWVYSYTESIVNMEYMDMFDMGKFSSNANVKMITIIFDENSKVSNFWANESNADGFGKRTVEVY